MSTTLIEKGQKIAELRAEATRIVTEVPKGKGADGAESPILTNDQYAKIADLGKQIDTATDEFLAAKQALRGYPALDPGTSLVMGSAPEGKSFGRNFAEKARDNFKNGYKGETEVNGFEAKTLLSTTSGVAATTQIDPGITPGENPRPTQAISLLRTGVTGQTGAISFVRDTTTANAAAAVAEGGTKPEAAMTFEKINLLISKIAVWIPVTEEELEDVEGMEEFVKNELGDMVNAATERDGLTGSGTSPVMLGIGNTTGVLTQAKGSDTQVDQILKAVGKIAATSINSTILPTGVILNPTDWFTLIGTKDTTGRYIFTDPQNLAEPRLWGLRVALSSVYSAGTGLVGDFDRGAILRYRKALTIKVSDSHADYFIKNQLAILAELRAVMQVRRPASFCKLLAS